MPSYPLKIKTNLTYIPFDKEHRGIYEFFVTGLAQLPLKIKKRRMLTDQWVLTFDYICSTFISNLIISVGTDDKIVCRNIRISDKWHTFSFDLTDYKDRIGQYILHPISGTLSITIAPFFVSHAAKFKIKNIRLRSRIPDEQKAAEIRSAYKSRPLSGLIDTISYLYEDIYPNAITSAGADDNEIKLEGTIDQCNTASVYLCELPMFKDFTINNLETIIKIEPNNGHFKTTLSRLTDQYGQVYDRVYSRWILTYFINEKPCICSRAHYVENTHTGHVFPVTPLKTKKGLGGIKYNRFITDLQDLGISYLTINIRINNFLRLNPGENNIAFEYNGKTYYADKRKIEQYDQLIRYAAEHEINVSAIILVYPKLWSTDPKVGMMLEHPEYERFGAYTMPNLTNLDSLNLYAAAIDFIASRYNRSDKKYGRIHRWIVHNEVNSGGIWTNVGDKTAVEFMEMYHKSMRLIYYTARKYDANAEVLISLDHHWSKAFFEKGCYSAVELLNLLKDFCSAEGNFKWGVAIHPYPENLVDPKSWLDKRAVHSPNTPLITFKNLEVIDAWIKNPDNFYEAHKRTLLLSEQNPNSIDYSETALTEQAAGLAYAWKKVMACDGIDAYIAHSWIDARFEGGLKTGLRKYPDDRNDPYGCKPAWYVFRDAGTPKEDDAFHFAKEIIDISSWKEIYHTVQSEKQK